MIRSRLSLALALPLTLLLWLAPPVSRADDEGAADADAGAAAPVGSLSLAAIRSRLATTDELPLDEQGRAMVEQRLREALGELTSAQALAEEERRFRAATASAEERLKETRAALTAPVESESFAERSLAEVEQRAQELQQELSDTLEQVKRLQEEKRLRTRRRTQIAAKRVEIQGEVRELESESRRSQQVDAGLPQPVLTALRTARQVHLRRLRQELASFTAEVESYDARRELLPARLALARLRRERLQARLDQVRAVSAELREEEARAQESRAKRLADQVERERPELVALAGRNLALAQLRGEDGLSSRLVDASERLERRRIQLAELSRRVALVQRKLEVAGMTRAMGRLLRLQLDQVLDVEALVAEAQQRDATIADEQYRLLEAEEQLQELSNLDVERALPEVELGEEELPAARRLLEHRRELLQGVIEDRTLLIERLARLNGATRELAQGHEDFETYLRQHVLWQRSSQGLSLELIATLPAALEFYLTGGNWPLALRRTGESALGPSLRWLLLLAALALPWLAWRAWRLEQERLEDAWKPDRDSDFNSLLSLVSPALRAGVLPVLLATLALFMLAPPRQLLVAKSVAVGALAVAAIAFPLLFLHELTRAEGLAPALFRWREAVLEQLHGQARILLLIAAPLAFVVYSMERQTRTEFSDSLGLLAFVAALLAAALPLGRIAWPRGPLVQQLLQRRGLWAGRLVWPLFALALLAPLVLSVISLLGYYFSALYLVERAAITAGLASGLFLLGSLLRRKLALARLREAVRAAREAREAAEGEEDDEQAEAEAVAEARREMQEAASNHVRRLVTSGSLLLCLFGSLYIWQDALPALERFDRLQVYPSFRVLPRPSEQTSLARLAGSAAPLEEESAQGSEGEDAESASPSLGLPSLGQVADSLDGGAGSLPLRLTVADLALALSLLVATVILFRNLPGLLELLVFEHLPMAPGALYAATTITRYVVAFVGSAAVLGTLGVGWANIQWLAAALTFGLAFGLQEIFANFVSGLILLFERPIRVGDVVTVGELSGRVSRIRMRATTIVDWDHKELVLPNKELVTGQVINWSLSDSKLRLKINVGVHYRTDVREAQRVLLEVARSHPDVLEDPEPQTYFTSFDDSTLAIELWVYVESVRLRFPVRNDLQLSIRDRFAEEDIEIAYPQRDLHLRADAELVEAFRARSAERRGIEEAEAEEAETEEAEAEEAEAEEAEEAEAERETRIQSKSGEGEDEGAVKTGEEDLSESRDEPAGAGASRG